MAVSGFLFLFNRILQFVTIVPIIGMLAYFVDGFRKANLLTPTYILLLFITSVLAGVWVAGTILLYARARHAGGFVALIDLAFVGTFIAAVVELRGITKADCAHFGNDTHGFWMSLGPFGYVGANANNPYSLQINKTCAMLKASFALGIIQCILFFVTFLLALLVRHHHRGDKVVVKRETHVSRHGSRRRSSSRDYYTSPRRSHHSHRSSRRYYV